MKLKTLLLGSAAAMIAFTGARAADAVIAEPEPVEYVKVCDAYGAGYFFIPGTETCLRISGYVDVQYEYESFNNNVASDGQPAYLGRVNFDALSETDYGTLRSNIRIEGGGGGNAAVANANILEAFIEIGNLAMGFRSTAFNNNFGGFPGLMLDQNDGFQRRMFLEYTYSAAGFAATGGVTLDPNNDKSVDPFLVASYTSDLFNIRAGVAYDTDNDETAYNARLGVTPVDGLTIVGLYQGASGATAWTPGQNGNFYDDFYGIGAQYRVTDTIAVAASYSDVDFIGVGSNERITVGLDWNITPGLIMRVNYQHDEMKGGATFANGATEADEFRVRFRRSF